MGLGFKIWLESEALDAYLQGNQLGNLNFRKLLDDPEIKKIMKSMDDNNLFINKKINDQGIFVIGNHRIPIILLGFDERQIKVKKLDGSDFTEIQDRWPVYPDPNDKSIVLLPSNVRIIRNDNAANFVKLLAKILADKKIGYGSDEYESFLNSIKKYIPYLSHDPSKLQALIDKNSDIKLDRFPLKSREELDQYSEYDPEQIDYVENFDDGMSWVTGLYNNQAGIHLMDDHKKIYMTIYRNEKNEIGDYDLLTDAEEDKAYIKPYLIRILKNRNEVGGDESMNLFPGFGFTKEEILDIIKANPNLRPDSKLLFKMLQVYKGGEEGEQALNDIYEMAPAIRSANITGVDYSHLCLITDIQGSTPFAVSKFAEAYTKRRISRNESIFIERMMDAPVDIVHSLIAIHKKLAKQTGYKEKVFNALLNDLDYNRYLIESMIEDIKDLANPHEARFLRQGIASMYDETLKRGIINKFYKGFILEGPNLNIFVKMKSPFDINYSVVIEANIVDNIADGNVDDYSNMLGIFNHEDLQEKKKFVEGNEIYTRFGTKNGRNFEEEDIQWDYDHRDYSITEYFGMARRFLNDFWHLINDRPVQ